MAKQMPSWAQWVCVVSIYAVMFLLWECSIPWLVWRIPKQIVIEAIVGVVTLLLYLKPAVSYHVKPYIWLIGVPLLPICKRLIFPNDFDDFTTTVWQQRLPAIMIYAVVPIIFCILGYVIHAVQVRRWRVGK